VDINNAVAEGRGIRGGADIVVEVEVVDVVASVGVAGGGKA
jgi:hypothetical protein